MIALLTVMSPLPPRAEAVVTITLLSPNCPVNVVTLRFDGVVVVSEKEPPPNAMVGVLAAVLMVISVGSSSRVPAVPIGALVSASP